MFNREESSSRLVIQMATPLLKAVFPFAEWINNASTDLIHIWDYSGYSELLQNPNFKVIQSTSEFGLISVLRG